MIVSNNKLAETEAILDYQVPEVRELEAMRMVRGDYLEGTASTDDTMFNAADDGGEENGVFSLDE